MSSFVEEELLRALRKIVNLSEADFGRVRCHIKERIFAKSEQIFKAGDTFPWVGYLAEGLVKKFYTTHEGNEFIKEFAQEGEIVAPYSGLLQNRPATYTLQALEPTRMILLPWQQIAVVFEESRDWMKIGKTIAELHLIRRERREEEFLCFSAADRLASFESQNRKLISRLTSKDLAAYLGITAESLSRIRRSMRS